MRNKIFKTVASAATAAILLTGCSTNVASEPTSTPTPTQSTETPAPVETETEEPTETETSEPEEVKVDVATLKTGDKVPASQIEEAKAAGVNVYVTSGGQTAGDGVVVERGTLPDVIKAEYMEFLKPGPYSSAAQEMAVAAREAGISAVIVQKSGLPGWNPSLIIDGDGSQSPDDFYDKKADAIKVAEGLAKKHGVEMIVVD